MSCLVGRYRVRPVVRVAALAVTAAALAGCSADSVRFQRGGPFHAAQSNTPPGEMTGAVPRAPASGVPVGRVESQPLPGSSSALPAPPPHHAAPAAAPTAPPQRQAAPSRSAPSGTHVVGAGETLGAIANRYGKSRTEIARANDIKTDARVRVGQRLAIPGVPQSRIKTAAAPAAPAAQAAARPVSAPKPAEPKAQANTTPAPAAKPQPQRVATLGAPPTNLKVPEERVERAQIAQPAAEATAEANAAQAATAGPSFRWPVRGRVIAGFGPKPSGQRNEGINLAVPEGTSVRAAEEGVVAYAGNELKGYGNLVLVRHKNGYVTAYAHASEIKVKRGEPVKRGQIIALAGQTGNVSSPQLHFEIRRGSTPVDPTPYLAGN